MLIHLFDIVFLWEGVGDAFLEFPVVGIVIEQYGIGFFAITPGTSCFLEISLYAVRTVHVDDEPHVRFVDTHAKGIGCHHHTHLVLLPVSLSFVFYHTVKTCMIESGGDACLIQQFCKLFRTFSAAGIDDGCALHTIQNM